MRTCRAPIAFLVGAVLLASGCRAQGLAFREDGRVEILEPKANTVVRLPVTVRWSARDMRGERFGVFVDTSPMPPLADLAYFAHDDRTCRPADGCPDVRYLADRGVYVTSETTFVIPALRDTRPYSRRSAPDRHTVAIAFIDAHGRRTGEAIYQVDFIVKRELS